MPGQQNSECKGTVFGRDFANRGFHGQEHTTTMEPMMLADRHCITSIRTCPHRFAQRGLDDFKLEPPKNTS